MTRLSTLRAMTPDQISYASSGKSRAGRVFIRSVENMTGRRAILKRARKYKSGSGDEVENFWAEMVQMFNLRLDVIEGALDGIPKDGPLVIVSNHPFGILDGLFMGYILSRCRPDFRIVAHRIFGVAPQIQDIILPISFDETPEAVQENIRTRKTSIDYLRSGGAIGIFPGGTVSTSRGLFGQPADPAWRTFCAKMILKSGAKVVPIYFHGQNSRVFQVASHMNYNLRVALLINEFRRRIGKGASISVGEPILPDDLSDFNSNGRALMDELRARTYRLMPGAPTDLQFGHEFEAHHRDSAARSRVVMKDTSSIAAADARTSGSPPS